MKNKNLILSIVLLVLSVLFGIITAKLFTLIKTIMEQSQYILCITGCVITGVLCISCVICSIVFLIIQFTKKGE